MNFRVIALFVVLAFTPWTRGNAWWEIQTPHFTIVTDNRAQGIATATDVETMKAIFVDSFQSLVGSNRPVIVFAILNRGERRELFGPDSQYYEAFFALPDYHYLVVSLVGSQQKRIFRQLFHALTASYANTWPAWVKEGYSGFFANSVIEDDVTQIGLPWQAALSNLPRRPGQRWSPQDLMLEDGSSAIDNVFYHQAWALMHYMLLGERAEQLSEELSRYLELLRLGARNEVAVREAFSDLESLEAAWDRPYATGPMRPNDSRLRSTHIVLPTPPISTEAFRVREMSPAETLGWKGRFFIEFGHLESARKLLAEGLELEPSLAMLVEETAMLLMHEGRADEALEQFTQAAGIDGHSYRTYYYSAKLRHDRGGDPSESDADLRRAIELDPVYVPAKVLLATVLQQNDEGLEEAISLVNQAIELEPTDMGHGILLGSLQLSNGQVQEARAVATRMAASPLSADERAELGDLQERLRDAGSEFRLLESL